MLGDRIEVALPACRALTREGHIVGAATSSRSSPVLASRAVAHRHVLPDRSAQQDAWTSALRDVVSVGGYEAVLACTDVDVARLLAARPGIASVPSMSPAQAVILDKGSLAQICADAGVAYPRTDVPSSPSEDVTIAGSVQGRAVVKAATPAVVTDRGIVHMPGMTLVDDPGDLIRAMARYRAAGLRPIVQEHVGGSKIQAAIIRRAGVTSCRLVALVERGTPAEATLRQLDSSAGLGGDCVAALERVADRAGYEGLLQAEFVTPTRGAVCLIDLNARLWGGLAFAELLGLRMTERAIYDAVGLPAPPMPPEAVGRRYHHVARELAHLAKAPGEFPAMVSHWSPRDAWDPPAWDDPRPHLVHAIQQARRLSWRR